MSRARHGAVALGAAVLLAGGCGGGSGPSIVLYNGQHTQLTTALVAAFQQRTGIAVELRNGDTVVLADQLLEEGSASPADVYLSENSPELMTLQQHHLLVALPRAILDQVPASERSPAGDWVGVALRVSSLVYDPALLPASQLPRSILDLAEPRFRGKVALAPTDSDFPPVVGAVIARDGAAVATRWLTGLKRNAQVYQDEESVVSAVERGDVACGVVNQYYWYRLRLELGGGAMHSELYYFPGGDPGSVTNISGAAVLASSSHRAEAERFVVFLVSAAGQKVIAGSDDFEYPARPGIGANTALPPLVQIAHTRLSVSAIGNDQQAAHLIEQVGLL